MLEPVLGVSGANSDSEPLERVHDTSLQAKWRQYLHVLYQFARSRTQVYMYVGPAVISLLIASNGKVEFFGLAAVALATYFASLATYIYNDVFDVRIDKTNSTNRPLVSRMASRKNLLILTTVLNLASIGLILTTNILATIFMATFISLGILYSHPRTSLKDRFLLKTIIAGTGALLTSFIGSLATGILPAYVIYVALVSFASLFVLGTLGDIGDLRGDREAKRRTFPIVVGVKPTLVMLILISVAIAFATVLINQALNMNLLGVFLLVGTCSGAIMILRSLIGDSIDRNSVMKARHKMRTLHLLLLVSMFLGTIQVF